VIVRLSGKTSPLLSSADGGVADIAMVDALTTVVFHWEVVCTSAPTRARYGKRTPSPTQPSPLSFQRPMLPS
jgi:hypothetical protein